MPPSEQAWSRRITVAPERLDRWLTGFRQRHGEPMISTESGRLLLTAPDGADALITLIWGEPRWSAEPLPDLVADMTRERRLGVMLVRKSAHAVGIAVGDELIAGSVDHHYVQARTKAGGWSQQRYARRRENQADRAWRAAAATVAKLILPEAGTLTGMALGGEARAVQAVLALPELTRIRSLVDRFPWRVVPTPDPRRDVLNAFPRLCRAVPILLNEAAVSAPV